MPADSNKKKIFIIISIVMGTVIVLAIGVVILLNLRQSTPAETDQSSTQTQDDPVVADYTAVERLYSQLSEGELLSSVESKAKQADPLMWFSTNTESGTIAMSGTNEYLTFDIMQDEDDAPKTAFNLVYHDANMTISETSENTFIHNNGSISSDFSTKAEAIADHQLFRN